VTHVNLGGTFNTEEVVVRERGRTERRFHAPRFSETKTYRWLNDQTVLFAVHQSDREFYALDVRSGTMRLVARIPEPVAAVDVGISSPHTFWYETADGTRHRAEVPR
jgi:hypothetical protein